MAGSITDIIWRLNGTDPYADVTRDADHGDSAEPLASDTVERTIKGHSCEEVGAVLQNPENEVAFRQQGAGDRRVGAGYVTGKGPESDEPTIVSVGARDIDSRVGGEVLVVTERGMRSAPIERNGREVFEGSVNTTIWDLVDGTHPVDDQNSSPAPLPDQDPAKVMSFKGDLSCENENQGEDVNANIRIELTITEAPFEVASPEQVAPPEQEEASFFSLAGLKNNLSLEGLKDNVNSVVESATNVANGAIPDQMKINRAMEAGKAGIEKTLELVKNRLNEPDLVDEASQTVAGGADIEGRLASHRSSSDNDE